MLLVAAIPISLVLPPDGATGVPLDARVAVSEGVEAVEIRVNGRSVAASEAHGPGLRTWTPDGDLPAFSRVDVSLWASDTEQHLSFETGDHTSAAPDALPDVHPWLDTTRRADGGWDIGVEAQQPDAEPFGLFVVAYTLIDGTLGSVDAAWPSDAATPTTGAWTAAVPEAAAYCAGVSYISVGGEAAGPVEVCAELSGTTDPRSGCSVVGAPGGPIWMLWLLLPWTRRYSER